MKKIIILFIIGFINIQSYNPNHLKHLFAHYNCPNCDLRGAFLQGFTAKNVNLDGADLSGASLSGARIPHASFKNSKLVGTIFNQAILNNANFNSADMTNASLVNSFLREASFQRANLTKANFFWARAEQANFTYAKFLDTIFNQADLYRANLANASGNMLIDYCAGYSPTHSKCADSTCTYHCTNFCCTTMQDGSIKTDKLNPQCSWDRRKFCSID